MDPTKETLMRNTRAKADLMATPDEKKTFFDTRGKKLFLTSPARRRFRDISSSSYRLTPLVDRALPRGHRPARWEGGRFKHVGSHR